MLKREHSAPPALYIGPPSTASLNSPQPSFYPPNTILQRQLSPTPPPSSSNTARTPGTGLATSHRRADSRSHLSPGILRREPSPASHQHYPQSSHILSSQSPHHSQQLQSPSEDNYPSTQSHALLWLSASQKLSNLELLSSEESSVFGPAHAKALEELRAEQLGLAQAWMRTECEDLLDGEHAELAKRSFGRDGSMDVSEAGAGIGGGPNCAVGGNGDGQAAIQGGAAEQTASGIGVGAGGSTGSTIPPHNASIGGGSLRGESGTEGDLMLARKRRELNDAHFNRVSLSVMDVVKHLDTVAMAMGVVEKESRGIWGSEVSDTSSIR